MPFQQPTAALRRFAYVHDELPAFHAGYLVLTLLVAALLNLGAFAVLIAAHMALDLVKYREHHHCSWRRTAEGIVRENLCDFALLAVALVFAVYLHSTVGLAGVSGLLRAKLTIVRAAATLAPKLKILQRFFAILAHLHLHIDTTHPRLRAEWSSGERAAFACIAASVALIAAAPVLMDISNAALLFVLAEELLPVRL